MSPPKRSGIFAALLVAVFAFLSKDLAARVTVRDLVDHQLVQRTTDAAAAFEFSGESTATGAGAVWLTIRRADGEILDGPAKVGECKAGRWKAAVDTLPVGGPYDFSVEIRGETGARATTRVSDILVGDIWVLAGQSNMQGRAGMDGAERGSPLVRMFDFSGQWRVAEEPLHELKKSADAAYAKSNAAGARVADGAGLGLSFAKEVSRAAGVPIAVLPCAVGGTAIARWDPSRSQDDPASLYAAMLRRVHAAGGRVKGVLWYQGEADARDPAAVPLYAERQRALVAALRRDLRDPKLPFHYAQLCRILDWIYFEGSNTPRPAGHEVQWTRFRETQRTLADEMKFSGMVATIDLELGDAIHLDTESLKRTGRRLANLALHETYGVKSAPAGPRLAGVRADAASRRIEVEFSGVTGTLRSAGRMAGFTLHAADGSPIPALFRAVVAPDRGNVIVLSYDGKLPEGVSVAYGAGTNPYCNVVDEADMAVPAFMISL